MIEIAFDSIKFTQHPDFVRGHFLKIFYFDIPIDEVKRVGTFSVVDGALHVEGTNERRIRRRFQTLLDRFFGNLYNTITKKKTIYVHQNSRIPLIGTNYFGLVDRGTNVIEVKPMNGCNIDCIYCSVDENKRTLDFVCEEEYLFEEFKKIVDLKKSDKIEAHIAGQCEPMLYAPLAKMIKDISSLKVKTISIDTNGQLLSKEKVDELVEAGLTRINLSVNSLDPENARMIAHGEYDVEKIKEIIPYIADRIDLIIAPVLVQGVNEEDLEELVKWIKSLKTKNKIQIGIQNYLRYRFGKKPAKEMTMHNFFKLLKSWEKKYEVDLTNLQIEFEKDVSPEKPFKKDEIVEARIVCDGRFPEEKIASAEERSIIISDCKKKGKVKVKITADKDNIYFGKC